MSNEEDLAPIREQMRLGDLGDAERALRRLLLGTAGSDVRPEVRLLLATVLRRTGRNDEAMQILQAVAVECHAVGNDRAESMLDDN